MFDRFTKRARQVILLAPEESRGLDHDRVRTEHTLLGVLHQGEASAEVLERHGLTLERLRAELMPSTTYGGGPVPLTLGAKVVLERALRESLALARSRLDLEHLLLALADEIRDDDPGASVGSLFRAAGVDPAALRVVGERAPGTRRTLVVPDRRPGRLRLSRLRHQVDAHAPSLSKSLGNRLRADALAAVAGLHSDVRQVRLHLSVALRIAEADDHAPGERGDAAASVGEHPGQGLLRAGPDFVPATRPTGAA